MSAASDQRDLTARANIRNAALRMFAERGHDAVTVREIATGAGVSPSLVLHHFGSKDGLLTAVDAYAAESFDAVFAEFSGEDLAQLLARETPRPRSQRRSRGPSPTAPRCRHTCAVCC